MELLDQQDKEVLRVMWGMTAQQDQQDPQDQLLDHQDQQEDRALTEQQVLLDLLVLQVWQVQPEFKVPKDQQAKLDSRDRPELLDNREFLVFLVPKGLQD